MCVLTLLFTTIYICSHFFFRWEDSWERLSSFFFMCPHFFVLGGRGSWERSTPSATFAAKCKVNPKFTFFTGTKVQILTQMRLPGSQLHRQLLRNAACYYRTSLQVLLVLLLPLSMCPHTTMYMCPHTRKLLFFFERRRLLLPHQLPGTTIYVSAY